MSRALVLGGGGPVGVGWQAGLLAGLLEAGLALRNADVVIGTSAGSVVGAQLTSGHSLADVVAPIGTAPPWASSTSDAPPMDLAELLASGPVATVSEEEFAARFDFLRGVEWPENFRCTSFGSTSGRFAVWDRAAGVELRRAVASSCSVPGLSPAITIGDERYIDGGARDMLNADLAVGHDRVVALSCVVLEPPAGLVPDLLAARLPDVRTRIGELQSTGSEVEVVEPSDEVRDLSGWGAYLMDFARTAAAFDAGVRQSKEEARRLEPFSSG
ncbi:MAG TPA: patatin-like phospholipase family protein [Acidimicrobiia bacterium]|nr:patatin-like phospholipase family protein [Acidimicrobiia bacterium]